MNKKTKFLDYDIIECSNGDGIVLCKNNGQLYETHLGNFNTIDEAKVAAVKYFMIARPSTFATHIYRRTVNSFCYQEFFTFQTALQLENIPMPPEITASKCGNYAITFNGKII